jgi:hypothetical protein
MKRFKVFVIFFIYNTPSNFFFRLNIIEILTVSHKFLNQCAPVPAYGWGQGGGWGVGEGP